MLMLLSRQALFRAAPRPVFRLSNGVASSRWSHCIDTWFPRNNTIERSPAILIDMVEVQPEKEMNAQGREVLQQALDRGLVSEAISGRVVIGNRNGLDLVAQMCRRLTLLENQQASQRQDIHTLKTENKILMRNDAMRATEIDTLTDKNKSLEYDMSVLKLASEEYDRLRQRFLSTYKRYIYGRVSEKDLQIIEEGNSVADGGDAIADARLYSSGSRRDNKVFQKLYGLHAVDVPSLGMCFPNR